MWNSLSQVVLKIASPGCPGLSIRAAKSGISRLVDPDNRRPVDYSLRMQLMNRLRLIEARGALALIEAATQDPTDGLIKLYVTSRALCFRKSARDLFTRGSYVALRPAGERQNHAIAFARALGRRSVIAAVGRFYVTLGAEKTKPTGREASGRFGPASSPGPRSPCLSRRVHPIHHRDRSAQRQTATPVSLGLCPFAGGPARRH